MKKLGQNWKVTSSVWAEIDNVKKLQTFGFSIQPLHQRTLVTGLSSSMDPLLKGKLPGCSIILRYIVTVNNRHAIFYKISIRFSIFVGLASERWWMGPNNTELPGNNYHRVCAWLKLITSCLNATRSTDKPIPVALIKSL